MSSKELDRAQVLALVVDRRLSLCAAAERLQLSERQARWLLRRYEAEGPAVLASRRRGKSGNRQLRPELCEEAIGLVRERYHDFGPTLALEKLQELHGLKVSVETKMCCGRTPLETFADGMRIWKEKQLGDHAA